MPRDEAQGPDGDLIVGIDHSHDQQLLVGPQWDGLVAAHHGLGHQAEHRRGGCEAVDFAGVESDPLPQWALEEAGLDEVERDEDGPDAATMDLLVAQGGVHLLLGDHTGFDESFGQFGRARGLLGVRFSGGACSGGYRCGVGRGQRRGLDGDDVGGFELDHFQSGRFELDGLVRRIRGVIR